MSRHQACFARDITSFILTAWLSEDVCMNAIAPTSESVINAFLSTHALFCYLNAPVVPVCYLVVWRACLKLYQLFLLSHLARTSKKASTAPSTRSHTCSTVLKILHQIFLRVFGSRSPDWSQQHIAELQNIDSLSLLVSPISIMNATFVGATFIGFSSAVYTYTRNYRTTAMRQSLQEACQMRLLLRATFYIKGLSHRNHRETAPNDLPSSGYKGGVFCEHTQKDSVFKV